MWGFDISQPSTQRGLVWLATCLLALVMIALGKTDAAVTAIAAGSGVAGALGAAKKD
jgi:hypothetical protein